MNTRKILLIVSCVLLFTFLVGVVFQTQIAIVIGSLAGGAAGAIVALYIAKQERARASDESKIAKRPDPAETLMKLLENLVQINILVRSEGLSEKAISTVEAIIDMLQKLLPEMNEYYIGNDLTWEVNRSAEVYLGNTVNPYVRLTAPEREASEDEFVESLGMLKSALEEISNLVRGNRVGEFAAKAKFLNARFASGS